MPDSAAAYIDPARPKKRYKPITAMRRMGKLLADKEDTEQVFHIIDALNGESNRIDLNTFMKSAHGPEAIARRLELPPLLDKHAPLKQLPIGTVGRTYVDFMQREGLSAAGLVAESEKFRAGQVQFDDDLHWYSNRLRDTHDIQHVLTGYGRDGLGELSLLAFSHSQTGGFGVAFIVWMGRRKACQESPEFASLIQASVAEGKVRGKKAHRIVDQDIEAMLNQPIDEVRNRLGLTKPTAYKEALAAFAELQPDLEHVAAA